MFWTTGEVWSSVQIKDRRDMHTSTCTAPLVVPLDAGSARSKSTVNSSTRNSTSPNRLWSRAFRFAFGLVAKRSSDISCDVDDFSAGWPTFSNASICRFLVWHLPRISGPLCMTDHWTIREGHFLKISTMSV